MQEASTTQQDEIVRERTALEKEKSGLTNTSTELIEEIQHWRAVKEAPPTTPPWPRSDRTGRVGAPFYRLLDFREHVPVETAARLEAALAGAGILDAWVSPSGRLDSPELDSILSPMPLLEGKTLLDALVPVEGEDIPAAILEDILRSVRLAGTAPEHGGDELLIIGEDGTWCAGPIRGHTQKDKVEHIGELAREARRQEKIAAAESALKHTRSQIERLDEKIQAKTDIILAVRREASAFPSVTELSKKYTAFGRVVALEDQGRNDLIASQNRVAAARTTIESLDRARFELARTTSLEGVIETLASVAENLTIYLVTMGKWFRAIEDSARAQQDLDIQSRALEGKRKEHNETRKQLADKESEARQNESELTEIRAASGKAVEELQQKLATAKERQTKLGYLEDAKNNEAKAKNKELGIAETQREEAVTEGVRTTTKYAETVQAITNFAPPASSK